MNNKNPFSLFFISICLGIVFIPIIMTGIIIGAHQVFGQNAGTPTTELTSPTPNLQCIPGKNCIILTGANGQIQAIPIQESSASLDSGSLTGIIGILTAVGTGLWAKISGSKDNKQTNAAVLQGMTVDAELAKYIDKIADPAKVAAVEGTAPAVKITTLEKNKEEFAEKAVKS